MKFIKMSAVFIAVCLMGAVIGSAGGFQWGTGGAGFLVAMTMLVAIGAVGALADIGAFDDCGGE